MASAQKIITFAVPCYNSAEYMDKCVESILPCGDDIEIILVNDGSTKDDTAEIADRWASRYPDIVKAIHQENGGHGAAVNTGLANASGIYFKVVDSDDWLDVDAAFRVMEYLRGQVEGAASSETPAREASAHGALAHDASTHDTPTHDTPTDLVISNYVYEKVYENTSSTMKYAGIFPVGREFGWDDVGHFGHSHYILMHSVIYRTELLREIGLKLPEHCFYVDNIFVYVPLPYVKTMYYLDVDMYRYFIGREGQSVNESVMMGRVDQQLLITRTMIDSVDVMAVENKRLRKYLESYLSMMMCICTVFLRMRKTLEDDKKLEDIWDYLEARRPSLYKHIRRNVINLGTNIPSEAGRALGLGGYRIAQKIFKFN